MSNSSETIDRLLDNQQITQVVARYGQAVDWLDSRQMKACFRPGSTIRFGEVELDAHGFCDMWLEMGSGFKARHHLFGIPVIAFDGSERARVDVPAMVAGTRQSDGARLRDFLECNRYIFTVTKAEDGWMLTSAQIFVTWSQGAPTPTATEAGTPQDHDVDKNHPVFSGRAS